jgi:hypothetical protein
MAKCHVQCCVCRKLIETKETQSDVAIISHGYCQICYDRQIEELEKMDVETRQDGSK